MYKCKHFKIWELVPRSMMVEPEWKLWWQFDDRALKTLDMLRDEYGPIIVNNWGFKNSGLLQQCGLRTESQGADLSQHFSGRAFDCHFVHCSAERVRQDCIDNWGKKGPFEYVTAIELGVPWFHFDVRNNDGGLLAFNK